MKPNGVGDPGADGPSATSTSTRSVRPNRAWELPVIVGSVATLARLLWVVAMSRAPKGLHDPAIYSAAAESISNGDGYRSLTGTITSYYPPGYPFFLGGIRWITNLVGLDGHFVLTVGVVQAFLGGVTAAAVVVIGRQFASGRVGLIAGLIIAFWPNLVIHSSLLLSETLFLTVFAILVAAVSVILTDSEADFGIWVLAAATMGAATLIRPQSAIVVLPAMAIALALSRAGFRRTVALGGVLLAGVVAVVGPWTIRNWAVFGSPVAISTNTGDNFCIGFNLEATGGFGMPDDCQTKYSYTDGPRRENARDKELRDRAITYIVENPAALPMLSVHKLTATFRSDHDGLRALESFGSDEFLGSGLGRGLRGTSDAYYFAVLGSALAGMVLTVVRLRRRSDGDPDDRWNEGVLARTLLWITILGALVPVVSFGEPRFKVPMSISLAVFSAVGVLALTDQIRGSRAAAKELEAPASKTQMMP